MEPSHAHAAHGTSTHDTYNSSPDHDSRDGAVATGSSRTHDGVVYTFPPPVEPSDREVTDAATILEFLAWGKRKQVAFAPTLPSGPIGSTAADPLFQNDTLGWLMPDDRTSRNNILMHIQILLPDRKKTYDLVKYHLESLLWYHCSFHGPSFLRQLDTFYDKNHGQVGGEDVDAQWVALLFAVIAATMCCASTGIVRQWGFRAAEQATLSHHWLRATVKCLDAANYMTNFSILSCQAVATLTMSAHLLGASNQQAVLLASVTRIAQSLGLHRLDEASGRTIEVESGRRVWSQLCMQDWFSITFSECYLISPLHTTSIPPLHCDDESLEDVPAHTPKITSYGRYLYSISSLMPRLQDGVESSNTLFTKYEEVLSFDRALRELATRMRPAYFGSVPIEPDWPSHVRWARSAAAISSSHKIIMVHRKFLSLSFTNSAFAFTRRTCVAASKTIMKEFQRAVKDNGPVLWIYHAFSVAAGITLCLDMIHSRQGSTGQVEHRHLVDATIRLLEKAEASKIASRGAWLLSKLISAIPNAEESSQARSTGKRSLPIPENDYRGGKRQKVAELLSVIQTWHDTSSSSSDIDAIIEPPGLGTPSYTSNSTSEAGNAAAGTNAAIQPVYEDDGYDLQPDLAYAGTDNVFSRLGSLDVGLADGTVDAFESLLNLTHSYGSTT
jgi:hypothetical protein